MIVDKDSWANLGFAFIGMVIDPLAGIGLLAALLAELAEYGWTVNKVLQVFFVNHAAWQESTGNEFTGDAAALFFGASSIPVGLTLISRTLVRYAHLGERGKYFIRRINNVQRKYLIRLHTYLSILALGLGVLHLTISSCKANPFPELGLILSGVLVATGLLFKWKAIPITIRKTLYQFHASLLVSGALLVILITGHAVMGVD